jgi:hypothetical protein
VWIADAERLTPSLGCRTKEVEAENVMKKPVRESAARKSAAKKATGANHRTARKRRLTGWRRAFERNLRAEGYSPEEARELVEIAAS